MDSQVDRWNVKDTSYYVKGVGSLLAYQVINLALGLVTTYLLTNQASKETYGQFTYVLAVMSVASLAALPGVDTAILYSSSKGHLGALRKGTALRLKTVWLGVLGMLAFAGVLSATGQTGVARLVALAAFVLPLTQGFNGFATFLHGQARFGEYTIVSGLIEVGKVIALALALFVLRLDGPPLVLAFLTATGILTALALMRYLGRSHGESGPEFDKMTRNLTAAAVLATIAAQADRLMVGSFLGMTPVAGYGLGVTLTEPLRGLGKLISQVLFPKIVHVDTLESRFLRRFAVGLAVLAVMLAALVLAFWVGYPLLQPILFAQYAESVSVVQWLIVSTALSIFDNVLMQILWGFSDLRPLYATQIAFPIARMVVLSVGAWRWGMVGILGGQVVFYAAVAVLMLGYVLVLAIRRQRSAKGTMA